MTTQVVRKNTPTDRVGNVVTIDGRLQIIEYSDLPESYAKQTNRDGSLKLWAGNIAVHVFRHRFLDRVQHSVDGLPFHRARKAVPYIDPNGKLIEPAKPNAIKFERFIFDLLPMAERGLVVEADAACVFAPVKNADGAATDTPMATKQAISNLHRSWLLAGGATLGEKNVIEIHPNWALNAEAVARKISRGLHIAADTYFV
jgi:UDP-N-acetylglucosamine/UDP-N-acetylgalactosamine diphosphorylase